MPDKDPAVTIRRAEPRDDSRVAHIIRTVLASFASTGPGSPYDDPDVAAVAAAYSAAGSEYHVVEVDGEVLGGGGFAPLVGTEPASGVCELRKMYFLPELRGRGVGRRLLEFLLDRMRAAGYAEVYLETLTNMHLARGLYESVGFRRLDAPMGATGHCACDVQFAMRL